MLEINVFLTVGENIIATIKMRNNFCYPLINFSNIAVARKSDAIVGLAITLERKLSKKKQRTDTKKDAKRIKSDNFTRRNS